MSSSEHQESQKNLQKSSFRGESLAKGSSKALASNSFVFTLFTEKSFPLKINLNLAFVIYYVNVINYNAANIFSFLNRST